MEKKKLGLLIIVLFAIIGYGSFYAYSSIVEMPKQAKIVEKAVNDMDNIHSMDCQELEKLANDTEKFDLKLIPVEDRKNMAAKMRSNPQTNMQDPTKELNNTLDIQVVIIYDLLLKWNVVADINDLNKLSKENHNLYNQSKPISDKIATDFENGDSKAVAADYRGMSNLLQQTNENVKNIKMKTIDLLVDLRSK
jgi:hypothetical protein